MNTGLLVEPSDVVVSGLVSVTGLGVVPSGVVVFTGPGVVVVPSEV